MNLSISAFQIAVIALFRYRARAAAVFSGCIVLSIVVCLVMHTQYAGTARVLVKTGRELIYRPDVGATQAALPTIDNDENIASAIEILESEGVARRAVETISLARLYPDLVDDSQDISAIAKFVRGIKDATSAALSFLGVSPEDPLTTAIRRFTRKLKVEFVKKTNIIDVRFLHPDPGIAALGANLVVDLFQRQSGDLYSNPNIESQQMLVDQQRKALEDVESRLSAYRRQYGVYDMTGQINALLQQKVGIDTTMKADAAHIADLKGMIATLETERAATPPRLPLYSDTERNRVVDDTEVQLLTLKLQEKQMASLFGRNYRPLITLRNQIALAEAAARTSKAGSVPQVRTGINETYQVLDQETMRRKAELASMFGAEDAMRAQITSIDEAIKQLSDHQRAVQDMEQDISLRTNGLQATYGKLVEAKAVEGLNRGKPASFSVFEAAIPADLANPARPLPILYTLIAALAGFVGAISTVFFSYRMSNGFLTPESAAQRLQLPVLAVIDYHRHLPSRGPVLSSAITAVHLNRDDSAVPQVVA
jgi:uncharacterized protein involved in exopolysaccharide biosynthesis